MLQALRSGRWEDDACVGLWGVSDGNPGDMIRESEAELTNHDLTPVVMAGMAVRLGTWENRMA
ncbi:MAG: hypothetical protein A2Y76_03150 [Planctomycetes bacterium RBG_13_60_9]|nr:MAG: hypothetical protein A2Y76_03150 [Planctomycetes bacterium RBG_13_60_9]